MFKYGKRKYFILVNHTFKMCMQCKKCIYTIVLLSNVYSILTGFYVIQYVCVDVCFCVCVCVCVEHK